MKLFIWDFHGVLEKGNDNAVLEITNCVLEKRGFSRRMSVAESELLSGHHWHEYFAYLLPDIKTSDHYQLQKECFEISQNDQSIIAGHIQLNDHAEYVLGYIQSKDYVQILISNTLPKHLDVFIDIVGINHYFPLSHRFGVNPQFTNSITKKHCLDSFLEGKIFPDGIISIGDSPNDMALIHQRPNAVGYLYTHPGRNHREVDCHHKIFDLRKVLQEIT